MKVQWKRADEYTQDCFNKWGYNPFDAILTTRLQTTQGYNYDLTILKHHVNNTYIPCHGGRKLPETKRLNDAKQSALKWFSDNTN